MGLARQQKFPRIASGYAEAFKMKDQSPVFYSLKNSRQEISLKQFYPYLGHVTLILNMFQIVCLIVFKFVPGVMCELCQ